MRTMTNTIIPPNVQYLLSCTLYTAIFVFCCLSLLRLGPARKRNAPWLAPFTIGFGLLLLNTSFYAIMWLTFRRGNGSLGPSPPWFVTLSPLTRVDYLAALTCLAWGAFLLWKSVTSANPAASDPAGRFANDLTPQEGVWPPAPTPRN